MSNFYENTRTDETHDFWPYELKLILYILFKYLLLNIAYYPNRSPTFLKKLTFSI